MTKGLRWVRRLLLGLLCVAALHAAAYFVFDRVGRARLETQRDLVRASGAPLTLAEVTRPPIPDAENAAVVFERAFDLLVDETDELIGIEDLWSGFQDDPGSLSDADAQILAAWIHANDAGMALVEEALERPRCLFRTDGSGAAWQDAEHVPGLQTVANVLTQRGYLEIRARDVDAALATSRSLLRLGWLTLRQATTINLFVGLGIESLGGQMALGALSAGAPSPDVLEDLLGAAEATPDDALLAAVLVFERAFGNSEFLRQQDGDPFEWTSDLLYENRGPLTRAATWLFDAPARRLDHARYLRFMARAIDLAKPSPAETGTAWGLLMADLEDPPWYDRTTRFWGTTTRNAMRAWEFGRVSTDLFCIALRIEMYLLTEGRLPATLDALEVPGGTRDRFGTGAYVYRPARDGGYLLYSVGMNGKDEGGLETDTDYDDGDVVWRRPARAP